MATGLLFVVIGHAAMAVVELPGLWGVRERRGELWAVIMLLLIGFGLAVAAVLGYRPPGFWGVIEAIFKPIGSVLFEPRGG